MIVECDIYVGLYLRKELRFTNVNVQPVLKRMLHNQSTLTRADEGTLTLCTLEKNRERRSKVENVTYMRNMQRRG